MSDDILFSESLSPGIDLLYDYAPFLAHSESTGGIGHYPPGTPPPSVAIVGAGISGLVAATELLRAGVKDITLYESRDRIGGRAWSQAFDPDFPQFIAEMGAMRFPPNGTGLFHYLRKHDIPTSTTFPDPGVVDTELHYRGGRHIWPAGQKPPALFRRVYEGWQALLCEGYKTPETILIAPLTISALLKAGKFEPASVAWQGWLDSFRDCSFYTAVVSMFSGPSAPGGEQWERPEDFELFGSLGIGSGGFLPVFQAGFTEILRMVINGYQTDQRLIPNGISSLAARLAHQRFHDKALIDHVSYRRVSRINKQDEKIRVCLGNGEFRDVDRVIVTSNNRAMQMVHWLTDDETFLDRNVSRAVRETHLTGSSKLFILTRNKFWLKEKLPVTIQSDGLVRGVYCLDYQPDAPDSFGVVLLSYTWEDDAQKMLAISSKKKRCEILVNDLAAIHPQFARHLIPAGGDYERYVLQHDWLTDPHSAGAFKLNYPGEDSYSQRLFFQPMTANNPALDKGLYLAGCSCSFAGGWIEGAIQTAINSACAVLRSTGGTLLAGNPLDSINVNYRY
ncbi:tryptophan 2-monooxygenase [Pseudomonas floridensis]|uniref:Tryptophan 2-monooxygenase n=1 Tax=Pseudomonas floridensis TaxID=1958950 RepID=A0A1X0N3V8_9PSED|nr:NAD(P)/FAD-dependent oxidoreductase [Pseudomonas floridensis]ORC58208.1 tryptophan 2-monooxygenase [Pseudomonas floridensis]